MAGAYGVISLSYLIDRYGDDLAKKALEQFVPYADDSTVSFLKEKAIPMEKRDLSRTYIAISQKSKKVLGYVTIGMKCIRIPKNNCLR